VRIVLLESELTLYEGRIGSLFWSVSVNREVTQEATADLGDSFTDTDSHFAQIKFDENFLPM
jgi:hypothetical protein